jgi:glutaredoxin
MCKKALEALQEIKIKYHWQTIDQENEAIETKKTKVLTYVMP